MHVAYREGVTVDDVCLVPASGGRGDHRRRRGRGLIFLVKRVICGQSKRKGTIT
jgi:hypothetical protein